MPSEEEELFEKLEKGKIISSGLRKTLTKMKGLRNILVHKYGEIDDKKAFENIKEGLKDFEMIIKEIEELLKEQKEKNQKPTKSQHI